MMERDYRLVISAFLPMITMFIPIQFIYIIQSLHIISNKKNSLNAAYNKLRTIFVSFPLKNKIGLTDGSNVVYGKNMDITIRIVFFLQTQLEKSFPRFIQRFLFNSQAIHSNVLFYYLLNMYSSENYLDYMFVSSN